jgi:hypothetical protein
VLSQDYSANFGGSAGPVITASCRVAAVSGRGVTLGCGGQDVLIPSAVIHEEIPAIPGRELHTIQIFVNLSSRNKLTAPQVLHLEPGKVPEWRSGAGPACALSSDRSTASPRRLSHPSRSPCSMSSCFCRQRPQACPLGSF